MTDTATPDKLDALPSLAALEGALKARNMLPGWAPRPKAANQATMKSAYEAAHWGYADARAALQSAGRLIGHDLADRRNFILRNPSPDNPAVSTLRTMICAYQSMNPGEQAPCHRHSAHALRVILESRGSYSIVDGHKHPMETGDVVLTPGWFWHGHGHEGTDTAYWFDGLDVPLNRLLEPMFYADHPDGFEKITAVADVSPMRFAWKDTVAGLAKASGDDHFGTTLPLATETMPTLDLKIHGWKKGFSNRPYRHTANTMFVVMKGSGRSTIGDKTFDWEFGDAIAAPAWLRVEHHASEDSVVFAMSDEALMRWTRYYRFEDA